MSWRDLIKPDGERVTLPWLGGQRLQSATREWTIRGQLPREHGWYSFLIAGRQASDPEPTDPTPELLTVGNRTGYLVGDRFATDTFIDRVVITVEDAPRRLPRVHLIDDHLDRFSRVRVGQIAHDTPLIYISQEMPLGPEDDVLHAFEDRKENVDDIKGVTPGLHAAFYMESFQRTQAERRREELARQRAEEQARQLAEARRRELVEKLGDGASRRAMAKVDFEEAARAALTVGGAELLSWKKAPRRDERIVRYRLDGQRFECVCDLNLRIVDAGICLNDYRTGEKGDTRFTLESLPAVVRRAIDDDVLVVFRHV